MRILIIEDEHRISQNIKKGLEQEHFTADIVYDGEEGYDLASSEDYDLIILDLMLPKMDGLSVCQKLRQDKNHTPIIMLTAKSQLHDKLKGFEVGADDYITKPFSFEELIARVRALTRRPKKLEEEILKYDGLTIDLKKFVVTRDETTIQLSPKEFKLLEYFLRHPEQIISKEQLINHVWSYETDILPNTVEAYIKSLRKKIDLPFENKSNLIQTVRGFGYKISK